MKLSALLGALSTTTALLQANAALENYTFEQFELEFNKNYSSETERDMRREAFYRNLDTIRLENEDDFDGAEYNVNEFADMTEEEMNSMYGKSFEPTETITLSAPRIPLSDLPTEVDWRKVGVVTEPKNQGQCGSCWAFAAIETLESAYALATGELRTFSEQHLVDCMPNPRECGGKGGCAGATAPMAFDFLAGGRVAFSSDYPYRGREGQCNTEGRLNGPKVVKGGLVTPNDYHAVMEYIATRGPLSVTIAASSLQFYFRGVKKCRKGRGSVNVNHAVQMVGYGTDSLGRDYWLIRNSWGRGWGENGYLRLFRDKPEDPYHCQQNKRPQDGSGCKDDPKGSVTVCGSCGILSEPAFVVLDIEEKEAIADEQIRM